VATIKNTPSSDVIQEQDCPTAFQQLKALVEEQAEAALGPLGFDLEAVRASLSEADAGGLWSSVVSAPLAVADAAIEETFGFDLASIASGKTGVRNALTALIDPAGIQAALTPSADIGSQSDQVEMINQQPDALKEKSKNALDPCNQNVFVATAATVISVAAGATNEVLKKVGAAQALFGMANTMLKDFGAGLFLLVGSELNKVYTLETTILKEIEGLLDQIEAILLKLGDEPFSFDHDKVVESAQVNLLEAATILEEVQGQIVDREGFDGLAYDRARAVVDQVADSLCSAADEIIPGFSALPYKLLAAVLILEAYRAQWAKQAARGKEQLKGMLAFPDNLKAQLQVDNFFAPILDLARCRIRHVVDDMAAVRIKGQLMLFITKEYKWCLELKVISETMGASRSLLETAESAVSFSDDVLGFISKYETQHTLVTVLPAEVDAAINDVILQARLKIQNQKAPARVVTSYVSTARDLVKRRREQLEAQVPMLLELLGLGNNKYVKAVAEAKQYVEFLTGKELTAVAKALLKGDFKSVFGADAVTASIDSQVQTYVNKVLGCVGSDDPAATEKLTAVAKQASDDERSKSLVAELVDGASSLFTYAALLEAKERQVDLSTVEVGAHTVDAVPPEIPDADINPYTGEPWTDEDLLLDQLDEEYGVGPDA
jgi:hypothetical protein